MIRTKLARVRRFLRLPRPERRDVVRAAAWLLAVDLGLRTVGFATVRRWLGRRHRRSGPETGVATGGADPERAAALARAVAVAAGHHLYPMRCLPRAVVLQTMLARGGIAGTLRIGVRRGHEPALDAHAWVEVDGRPLGEAGDVRRRYATLDLPPV